MNIAKSLKKLASNQTFVVLAAVVAVAAVYYYSQDLTLHLVGAMTGQNEAAQAADQVILKFNHVQVEITLCLPNL